MAERPVFIPREAGNFLVQQLSVPFLWHKGMAPSQKKKNVVELHAAAAARGLSPLLEVSTKSEEKLGQRLSAFNLKVARADGTTIPLECAYQGSKVFDSGGPFPDLFDANPREAKRDSRLQDSGSLVGFRFESLEFPLLPKTAFYEWLYICAIYPHREFLRRLHAYAGFTDIEFNISNYDAQYNTLDLTPFTAFQIKLVMRSSNAARIPQFRNLRTIAHA
jgi:hypothetical protein